MILNNQANMDVVSVHTTPCAALQESSYPAMGYSTDTARQRAPPSKSVAHAQKFEACMRNYRVACQIRQFLFCWVHISHAIAALVFVGVSFSSHERWQH